MRSLRPRRGSCNSFRRYITSGHADHWTSSHRLNGKPILSSNFYAEGEEMGRTISAVAAIALVILSGALRVALLVSELAFTTRAMRKAIEQGGSLPILPFYLRSACRAQNTPALRTHDKLPADGKSRPNLSVLDATLELLQQFRVSGGRLERFFHENSIARDLPRQGGLS